MLKILFLFTEFLDHLTSKCVYSTQGSSPLTIG